MTINQRRSLKAVNDHIQTKYPLIEVVMDDNNNLYLYSEDEKTALALAGLYTSGLDMHVNSIHAFGMDGMMQNVERVLADEFRFESDRSPITFE